VLRLRKALYGLKQAAREWNLLFTDTLRRLGWTPSINDPCLFTRKMKGKSEYLIIYVDDILIAAETEEAVALIKREIGEHFRAKDLGELSFILGIKVTRNRLAKKIWLSQEAYIDQLVQRYDVKGYAMTPMTSDTNPVRYEGTANSQDIRRYQEIIGSLLYAARCTRPDISNAVGLCGRFSSNPGPEHFKMVNRILCYIKDTKDMTLEIGGGCRITCYSDADWGRDLVDRKSTSGYAIYVGNSPVSWGSSKQKRVAGSTMEAEYVALDRCLKECLWISRIVKDFGGQDHSPVIYCDNQAAIDAARSEKFSLKAKHMDIKLNFVRDYVSDGTIELSHIESAQNRADMFTKPLPRPLFEEARQRIGFTKPSLRPLFEEAQQRIGVLRKNKVSAERGSVSSSATTNHIADPGFWRLQGLSSEISRQGTADINRPDS
jgi:hypothetical protein